MPKTLLELQDITELGVSPAFETSNPQGLPEAYDYVISRMEAGGNAGVPIPKRVTLLRPNPSDAARDQLFIDQLPIPREAWHYDEHDRLLSWRGAFGGGHLHLGHDLRGAFGNIGAADNPCSVRVKSQAQFMCDTAVNTGATYQTSGKTVIGFVWDNKSQAWQSAKWLKKKLLITYIVTPGTVIEPPEIEFTFKSLEPGAEEWNPDSGEYEATLRLGEKGGEMVWNLRFKANTSPEEQDSYVYWLQALEDAAASVINGVLVKDVIENDPELLGFQGKRVTRLATGYYQITETSAPFGVFDGQLMIGGRAVANSHIAGNVLEWSGLEPELQKQTGLPERGHLEFEEDGSRASDHLNFVMASRLTTTEALAALEQHSDLHPAVHKHFVLLNEIYTASNPDMAGLLAMKPFMQDDKGNWRDVVQEAVRQDLNDIMSSFIPDQMWKLVFPKTPQPVLTGKVAEVANSPVKGEDPKKWYQKLATAVITQGVAKGSGESCRYLNGPRAEAWLKTEVANSKVYHEHGQKLFHYRWQDINQRTDAYLTDQRKNAAKYVSTIDQKVKDATEDIEKNVAVDEKTEPDLKKKLTLEVQEAGNYAKTSKLFWAFAFYTYNTTPGILANIAASMQLQDGTTLSRLIQTNVSVLTALDASGYFAQKYTSTINIFMATNILPSMFGFTDDAMDFDLIKEYLETFVKNNLNNEKKEIADAAKEIQNILDDANMKATLSSSLSALRTFAQSSRSFIVLPYVASKFEKWFIEKFPRFSAGAKFFSGVFMSGVAALGIFNLFSSFKSWNKLSKAEKTAAVLYAVQLGVQVLAAIVQRGIRINAIFAVEGMTRWQRTAAINWILVGRETPTLEAGLAKIGNTTARWLGDTAGTVGKFAGRAEAAAAMTRTLISRSAATWTAKIFGKNLNEFMATRVGPVLIVLGMLVSIWSLASGESATAMAADILNIVSGALMLLAMIGEWAIAAEYITSAILVNIISFAGPLGMLVAFAGIGLMLYEMFKKPPDPVKEFADAYAEPAGFYVSSRAGSIDYADSYIDKDNKNLLMVGFSLSSGDATLCCKAGKISTEKNVHAFPEYIWQAQTDGFGMSRIQTLVKKVDDSEPVTMFLSLLKDNSVSFQPQMTDKSTEIKTQTWLSSPHGDAVGTSEGNLKSLKMNLQPVLPDKDGKYAPSQATGWVVVTESAIQINEVVGTVLTLTMSGMAPNYMTEPKLEFLHDTTPSELEVYGAAFGVGPSTPMVFEISGDPLPEFLNFEQETGQIVPNGKKASKKGTTMHTVKAKNILGEASAKFQVVVADSFAVS